MKRKLSSEEQNISIVAKERTKYVRKYSGADKSLARPGRKQATATEGFDVHISYL